MESDLDLSFSPVWCLPLKLLCSKNFPKESLSSVHLEGKIKAHGSCMWKHSRSPPGRISEKAEIFHYPHVLWRLPVLNNLAQLGKPHEIASYSFMKESTKSLGQWEYVGRLCNNSNERKSPFILWPKFSLLVTVLAMVKRHRDVCSMKSSLPIGRNERLLARHRACKTEANEVRHQLSRDGFTRDLSGNVRSEKKSCTGRQHLTPQDTAWMMDHVSPRKCWKTQPSWRVPVNTDLHTEWMYKVLAELGGTSEIITWGFTQDF